MSLQALVMLFAFLRLLYYFRANLKFGALVHTVIRVLLDILPMAALLFVFTLVLQVAFDLRFKGFL